MAEALSMVHPELTRKLQRTRVTLGFRVYLEIQKPTVLWVLPSN